jgi:HK97 family phage portal protein
VWPWQRIPQVEPRAELSISDPALAAWFGIGPTSEAGINVSESSALSASPVYRAVSLISSTIASLPLKTYRDTEPGQRQRVASFLDHPGGMDGLTPFEWKQVVVAQLLMHGRACLEHQRNGAGGLAALNPVHPHSVTPNPPEIRDGRLMPKTFRVTLPGGKQRTYTQGVDMTEILGLSLDGWYGLSVLTVARNSLGTTLAGDRAAARMFRNGLLLSGLVSPADEDVDEEDAKLIKAGLDEKTAGWEHAGEIAFVNRKLKFDPWTMSAQDAQFIESRQFQIEEVARWFGIPPFELMQTEKQTSWGTGIEAQQRGLARGNLLGWTMRIEQRTSRLLGQPRFSEFDFAALERPTPVEEIRLILEQIRGGLITVNEGRRLRNLPPVEGGDELREPKGTQDQPATEGAPA